MKLIIISSLLIYLSGCAANPSPLNTGLEGKTLPSFDFLLMDSITHLNTNNIPTGKPFVVLLFSPYCPYCRAETEEIIADMNEFRTTRFYFLSSFPFSTIKQYYDHYKLEKYTNIVLGQDFDSYSTKYFNANAIPYIAIYDKNKQLKRVFIGNIGTKLIKDVAIE